MTAGTAAQAYEARQIEVIAKLATLSNRVADHGRRFRAEGSTNWGYVGDLRRIEDLLTEALGDGR